MKKIKIIIINTLLLLSFSTVAQSSTAKNRGYVIWDFDLGYNFGTYTMPSIDKGTYGSVVLGSRLGFNFSKLFLGVEGRWGFPHYKSEFENSTVDNLNNPRPDDSSTSWGPSIGLKFNAIEFHYALLSESFKYEGNVSELDTRNVYHKNHHYQFEFEQSNEMLYTCESSAHLGQPCLFMS
jgi:hypothetical protein